MLTAIELKKHYDHDNIYDQDYDYDMIMIIESLSHS